MIFTHIVTKMQISGQLIAQKKDLVINQGEQILIKYQIWLQIITNKNVESIILVKRYKIFKLLIKKY